MTESACLIKDDDDDDDDVAKGKGFLMEYKKEIPSRQFGRSEDSLVLPVARVLSSFSSQGTFRRGWEKGKSLSPQNICSGVHRPFPLYVIEPEKVV